MFNLPIRKNDKTHYDEVKKFFNLQQDIFNVEKKISDNPENDIINLLVPINAYVKLECKNGILTIFNRELDDTTHKAYNLIRGYYNRPQQRYVFYTEYVKTYTTEQNGVLYRLYSEIKSQNKLQDFCDIYYVDRKYFKADTNEWKPLVNRIFTTRRFSYTFSCINYCIIG